jgi:hypothetical protein
MEVLGGSGGEKLIRALASVGAFAVTATLLLALLGSLAGTVEVAGILAVSLAATIATWRLLGRSPKS